MKLKSPKQKGDAFERELSSYLNSMLGLRSHRTPLSGGGTGFAAHHGPSADLTGTPLLWIEAKRTERVNVHAALQQAERACPLGSIETPVVITRRNREPIEDSLVVMRLGDFVDFYDALLKRNGYNFLLPTEPEIYDDEAAQKNDHEEASR